ncbi:MAG TPA: GatB/YqeY domain-containing protein [Gammaproteobacteria bacterium]|nr:GatB/YqeY domain-containing protein [Gammaproteobacteria bacterium]
MSESLLKQRITEDMKISLRAGNKTRLGVIRLILSAIKQREIDERIVLDDTQVLAVLDKMIKQRRDSIAQYEAALRQDLADQESYEIGVLQEFMPAPLSEAEIDALIELAISSSGASSGKDMGKVIGVLKPQMQGRADMGKVSAKVKAKLGG